MLVLITATWSNFVLKYLPNGSLQTAYTITSITKKKISYLCIKDNKMERELLKRITINPDISHGKPTVRNTRYKVGLLLNLLSAGMTFDEIIEDYPALEIDDIRACLAFASQLTKIKSVYKVVA